LFPGLEIALTQTELHILRAFGAEPGRCMTLSEVMAAGGYGKSATSRSLRRLRELGLIAKPPGTSRKGDSITAAGAAFLDGNHGQTKL
jgi:DNA-binding MarR family transcriptional regulator